MCLGQVDVSEDILFLGGPLLIILIIIVMIGGSQLVRGEDV
jgi:hypothetical protein